MDDRIIPYITDICKRDPKSGKVVTGGIVSCKDSSWLLSWTINRQGQFKDQDKDKVCVWVYGLFTDVPGDYIKKPMKECTGREITEEWLYHLGVPEVWGSVYDIRELLSSSVKLMDGKSPLEIELPGPLNALKKPVLYVIKGTVVEKVLRDQNVLKEGML